VLTKCLEGIYLQTQEAIANMLDRITYDY